MGSLSNEHYCKIPIFNLCLFVRSKRLSVNLSSDVKPLFCFVFSFSLPTVEPFKEGLSNRSVTAIYTSTCCNPTASIIAVDMSGNTGSCELSAVTQVINIEADTENAELNLKLGETSKLGFLIRNLGTKGSFTLQALENKHFISYVAPLNVNLDHNEEAKGEVILTGQRETGSNKTSLLITAVPLTQKVNVSHVKLLEIRVTVGSWLGWNVTADAYPKLLIIQYGVKAVLNITLKNNGLPGRFDLKVSVETKKALLAAQSVCRRKV